VIPMNTAQKWIVGTYVGFCLCILIVYIYTTRTPQQQRALVVVGVKPLEGVKDGN